VTQTLCSCCLPNAFLLKKHDTSCSKTWHWWQSECGGGHKRTNLSYKIKHEIHNN